MARVYKVWDEQRAAYLALKVLDQQLAADPVFLSRFEHEARILEKLQHPNIVRIYGLEKSAGLAFILMDFIDGLTLRQEIKISPDGIRPERITQILQPVCAGLHYAHQQGMVHCDIKPGNIMIHRNGNVYLTDFGIARVQGSSAQPPASAGTLSYMPPEQIRGETATPASDIYALGVVLFEMLTGGVRPFQDASGTAEKITAREAMLAEKLRAVPPTPRAYRPDISPELEAVVMRCLQPDPRFRYASTLDLLTAWEAAMRGDTAEGEVHTQVDTTGQGLAPAARRRQGPFPRRSLVWAAALAVFAVLALTLSYAFSRSKAGITAKGTVTAVAGQQTVTQISGAKTEILGALGSTEDPLSMTPVVKASATQPGTAVPSATTPATPTPLGGGQSEDGWIAFASDRADGATPQIWIIQASGRDRDKVTNSPKGACQPTWSPDGKKIAYITPCSGPRETYPGADIEIVDLTTSKVTPLNLPGGGFDPDWSPNGNTIAYTRLDVMTGHTDIYAVNLDTGEVTPLMERGIKNAHPSWSPDGRYLAFTSEDQGVDEIWQMRADGSSPEVLTQAGALKYFSQPAWSPDGHWILATMKDYGTGKSFSLVRFERHNPRGGESIILPDIDQMQDGGFSPDGRWVVYWTYLNGSNLEALMVEVEGGTIVNLSDHKARDFHPVWNR